MESMADVDVEMTAVFPPSFVVSETQFHSLASDVHVFWPLTVHALTSPLAVGESTCVPVETWVVSKMTSHTPDTESGTSTGVNQQIEFVPETVVEVALDPAVVLAARFVVQPLAEVALFVKNHFWFPEMSSGRTVP